MKIDYLLIGHGMDGRIYQAEYPAEKIRVVESTIRRAGDGSAGDPVHSFEVYKMNHGGQIYAIGLARSIPHNEMVALVEASEIRPIPEELL